MQIPNFINALKLVLKSINSKIQIPEICMLVLNNTLHLLSDIKKNKQTFHRNSIVNKLHIVTKIIKRASNTEIYNIEYYSELFSDNTAIPGIPKILFYYSRSDTIDITNEFQLENPIKSIIVRKESTAPVTTKKNTQHVTCLLIFSSYTTNDTKKKNTTMAHP